MWGVRRYGPTVSSMLLHTLFTPSCFERAGCFSKIISFNLSPRGSVVSKMPSVLNYHLSGLLCSLAHSDHGNPDVPMNQAKDFTSDDDDDDDGGGDNDDDGDSDEGVEDDGAGVRPLTNDDEGLSIDVRTVVNILQETRDDSDAMSCKLEQCSVVVSSALVVEVLSQLRNDWKASYAFFLWARKQPTYSHSVREYHLMISILTKMRKFDTGWALIDDMRGIKSGPSLVTPQTLLIMIKRYSAVHDVGRAIHTFYAHKRFGFVIGIVEFQNLLSALCRYKNVQDAEYLLFSNKNGFPRDTKSFNIILNGWCNVIGSLREARRFWREMSKRGISYDVLSYGSMISCYSKSNNLYEVLKLFGKMKDLGIAPDRKVYNAVIHALAKGRLVKEALHLLETMEEKGISPNSITYNSLLKPVCKARQIDMARKIFDEMLQRCLPPTTRTFHAIFRILRTGEEVFELLEKMKILGCQPTNDTYIMLIRKFCRWRQLDNVFKLWTDMNHNGISPDRSSYIVLIHGLFLNQKLDEAYKYYLEMKEKSLLPDPRMDEILRAWVDGKEMSAHQNTDLNSEAHYSHLRKKGRVPSKNHDKERDLNQEPGTKAVVRECGFSFWK